MSCYAKYIIAERLDGVGVMRLFLHEWLTFDEDRDIVGCNQKDSLSRVPLHRDMALFSDSSAL